MLGTLFIGICAALWATDALFRTPLSRIYDARALVLYEHLIGVVACAPWFLARRRELRRLNAAGWLSLAFIGSAGSALATVLFTASYRHVNPSVSILLQKTQPLFTVFGARVILGEIPLHGFYKWCALALLGSILVSWPEIHSGEGFGVTLSRGIVYALAASLIWGLCTVFGKWITSKISFPVTAFMRYLWGLMGIVLLNLSVFDQLAPTTTAILSDQKAITGILYVSLVSGVAAVYLYYAGLKRVPAAVATFAEMLFPVAAVFLNWRVLGQGLHPTQLVGTALLFAAVYFINRR